MQIDGDGLIDAMREDKAILDAARNVRHDNETMGLLFEVLLDCRALQAATFNEVAHAADALDAISQAVISQAGAPASTLQPEAIAGLLAIASTHQKNIEALTGFFSVLAEKPARKARGAAAPAPGAELQQSSAAAVDAAGDRPPGL